VRTDIAWRREALLAEARTVHRILSQATTQLDAVLATLALVAGAESSGSDGDTTARLPTLYPQVQAAWRRDAPQPWTAGPAPGGGTRTATAAELAAAEAESAALPAALRRPVLAAVDGAGAVYTLVLAGSPASLAMRVDARRLAPAEAWPWAAGLPLRVTLRQGQQRIVLQDAGDPAARPFGLTDGFELSKPLSSASQPLLLHAQRFAGPAEWPWAVLAAWTGAAALLLVAARHWRAASIERRRAAELARLAQTARLNTLGELAAGIAHELSQPLTATLAGTQSAKRTLREQAAAGSAAIDLGAALQALELAGSQARRAAEVVARLRRPLQPGAAPAAAVATEVAAAARRLAALLEPELAQHGIALRIEGAAAPAHADPVAVEQILHNLLSNAMHALQLPQAPAPGARRIAVRLSAAGARVLCAVRDNGPGVAAEAVDRIFEPFFSTRAGGLGLGLPLCQTLALALGGQVRCQTPADGGAEFVLELPAADAAAAAR
jgi:signal transduction histidine kinase